MKINPIDCSISTIPGEYIESSSAAFTGAATNPRLATSSHISRKTSQYHVVGAHPGSVFLLYHSIVRQLFILFGLAQRRSLLRCTRDSTIRMNLSFFAILWFLLTIQTLSSWHRSVCFSNIFVVDVI
jgi:hypothetical protein